MEKLADRLESDDRPDSELKPELGTRIAAKVGKRTLFIDATDIIVVESKGNYVVLHHKSGDYVIRQTLYQIEEKLGPFGFVRIHRSLIVNSVFVEEIEATPAGDYLLQVEGGEMYMVSRNYRSNLQQLASVWLCPPVHA